MNTIIEEPSTPAVAVRPEEAFRAIGVGRTIGYAEIKSGRLKSFMVGSRRLVPVGALAEWVADRMAEQS